MFTGGSYFEGPRWHDGALVGLGLLHPPVTRVTPDGDATVVTEVEQQPSGLGWLPDGSLLVVSMKDQRLLRARPTAGSTHADLAPLLRRHLNDMVVDAPAGLTSATSAST